MRQLVLAVLLLGSLMAWGKNFVASGRFQKFLDDHPHPVWTARTQYGLAHFYYITSDYEKAKVCFYKVVEHYPENPLTEHAHYNYAVTLESLGARAQALQAYKDFLKLYPQSSYAKVVQKRLEYLNY